MSEAIQAQISKIQNINALAAAATRMGATFEKFEKNTSVDLGYGQKANSIAKIGVNPILVNALISTDFKGRNPFNVGVVEKGGEYTLIYDHMNDPEILAELDVIYQLEVHVAKAKTAGHKIKTFVRKSEEWAVELVKA